MDLKPEGFKLLKFKEVVLKYLRKGSVEHLITAFWDYILLLEIAYKLLENDRIVHLRDHRIYDKYRTLSDLYSSDSYVSEGDFSERMARLLESVENDFRAQFTENQDIHLTEEKITELLYKHDIRVIRRELGDYLASKSSVWILIDNVDKGWPTRGIRAEDLVIVRSLLEATRKLEHQLNKDDIQCKTLVFLRNDVYELLVGETSDRGKEVKALLDWSDSDALRELLRRRLIHNGLDEETSFTKIWGEIAVSHVDGQESSQYLIDRCLMRPRELIDAVNHCRGYALNRGHGIIEEADIRDGMRIHSQDLAQEISYEIRDISSIFEDILYLFIGVRESLSYANLIEILDEFAIKQERWDELIDLLLWYGVLGVEISREDVRFIFSVNYNMKLLRGLFRKQKTPLFRINPAFHAGLEITASS